MDTPQIKARRLSKTYMEKTESQFKALDDISFDIYEGEIIGISGSSGSGKTTLLGILGCLETPSSGYYELFGQDVEKLSDRSLSEIRLQHLGFIFQEHNLLPALTVKENIELPLSLLGESRSLRADKVRELLQIVELDGYEDRYPSQLSRGQRQRIAAVRAFVNEPKLVLGDEPTSDLDPDNTGIVLDYLRKVNREMGTTIIIAVTTPDLLQGFSTRNLLLKDGKLV